MILGGQLFSSKGSRNYRDYGIKKSRIYCGKIDKYYQLQTMKLIFTLPTSFQGWTRLSNSFQRIDQGKEIIVTLQWKNLPNVTLASF